MQFYLSVRIRDSHTYGTVNHIFSAIQDILVEIIYEKYINIGKFYVIFFSEGNIYKNVFQRKNPGKAIVFIKNKV